jgi:hypothetical protein
MKRVFQPRRARHLDATMSFGQEGGTRRHQVKPSSSFFAFFAAREISFHRRDGSREAAKPRRRQGPWARCSAKTSLVNETGRISGRWKQGDSGLVLTPPLGGFEPVSCFSALSSGAMERRSDAGVRGVRPSVAPPGAGCSLGEGTQRSRAGLSSGGPPGLGPRIGTGLVGWFRVVGVLRGDSQASNPSLGAEPADASTPPG